MSSYLVLPSPAKLNLFLHINGRREDGYHLLQSIFQFIDRCDELKFQLRSDSEIEVGPDIPGVAKTDNLIYRAARLLQQHSHCQLGADIELHKILPMGGGLGGGSSNAATALLGLNHLWQLNLSIETLAELGLQLGADVPVFVRGFAAWAEGVGEILKPMMDLEETWFVVVVPQCHVNTGEIFSHKELTRNTPIWKMSAALRGEGRNDCEAVVTKLYKEVDNSLNLLKKFGSARMTGTGACCYLECNSKAQAQSVRAQLPADIEAFIAKGVNHSPLHQALQKALNSQVKN
ncbi:4-(cytidine 5'-diphospho)-2-C-methyl-D-erythritol kinase [Bermanella marisrubri]|uniref:4-diphosphocytidyl-2-C-methyl-D-erythritol kinase n=1 Tax=Bermanella marisrubri TaxID=207949 RepID=Q1N3M4_9GAMM|nr:4-(cytidine 5'-diphospho)-2-C-methyl-D-erythritol kinase [Bermanella marisrubri]EAT12850.1 4-diphosphocytidyl-2-C-methyl-D-erythritol kinase [Oceanobacter sp. RED65] [Bermanella marisrubri]QIZ83171.1 4-(cytidine 5'-diphospho)-2-C-methyl-D-erythritol kinase [Bermanella marisrubri]